MPNITVSAEDVRRWGGKTLESAGDNDLNRVISAATNYVALRVEDWREWTDADLDQMAQAVIQQSARWWSRKSAPNGVAGFGGDGAVVRFGRFDPDVEELLAAFDLPGIA